MSLTHLRAGVIGTGFIGPVHIEALKRLGIQVVAVCDTDANVATAAARFGIAHPIGGFQYQRLVAHPEVDVVHVASPNRLHAEHSLAALAAGKHVVCEKPLAMTSQETAAIVAAAKASRRVFAVNYNLRFYAALQTLRSMVAAGEFGRIIHVNGSYFQDWLFHDTDYNWRLLPKEGGKLRALADIGTHWMDAASFVLGDHVREVFANLGIHHKKRRRPLGEVKTFGGKTEGGRWQSYTVETEDFASVLLKYGRGTHGTLSVSQVAAGRKNQLRIEIYGEKQSAWWDSESPEQLVFGHRDTPNEIAIRGAAGFSRDEVRPYMDYPAGHVEGFADSFKMQMRAIYSRIAGAKGTPRFATVEDGDMEVRLCEAIMASHASRQWQAVAGAGRARR
jgi:predicted dehydrogenase